MSLSPFTESSLEELGWQLAGPAAGGWNSVHDPGPPPPPPASFTVDDLLSALHAIASQLGPMHRRTEDLEKGGDVEARWWRAQLGVYISRHREFLLQIPGIPELQSLCGAFWGEDLTLETARRIKGLLHGRLGLSPQEAGGLQVADAAARLRSTEFSGYASMPTESSQPQTTNRFGTTMPPCPGCGSPPAANGNLDDICPRCGAYTFYCGIVELRPLPTEANGFPDPIYQQRAGPFWRQLPPSQVRTKKDAAQENNAGQPAPARHSVDFRSVHWFGTDYSFTRLQAACVKVLWEAWQNGTPELDQQTVLTAPEVDAESKRLAHVFKGHPSWGTMIVPGKTAGSYRLADSTTPKA